MSDRTLRSTAGYGSNAASTTGTCVGLNADAVVCRHVIEHIPDPVALLRVVRGTLAEGTARVFFETPSVDWILEHGVVWDFFYEHCSYFSDSSLATAFRRAGFAVDMVERTFGRQYLWAEAHAAPPAEENATTANQASDAAVSQLALRFAAREAALVDELRERLERLARSGPVAIWGAGAKGVTLANLVDPTCRLVSCIVDLNPNKQGGYLPGTGHPIVAPARMADYGVRTAVLTNPEYFEENARLLRDAALDINLMDLMRQDRNALSY